MLPKEVTSFRWRDEPVFEPLGGVRTRKVLTFMVGPHGPFQERFEANEFHEDAINRRVGELIAKLRAAGEIPPEGT